MTENYLKNKSFDFQQVDFPLHSTMQYLAKTKYYDSYVQEGLCLYTAVVAFTFDEAEIFWKI